MVIGNSCWVSRLGSDLLRLGHVVDRDVPDVLDTRDFRQSVSIVLRVNSDGSTVKDVVLVADPVVNCVRLETVVGISMAESVMVLNDVGVRDNVGLAALDLVELSSRDQRGRSEDREDGGSDLHRGKRGMRGRI